MANISLLLGSKLAGSMDSAVIKEAREAQIRDCPNCAQLEKIKRRSTLNTSFTMGDGYGEIKQNRSHNQRDASSYHDDVDSVGLDLFDATEDLPLSKAPGNNPPAQQTSAQIHTRHMSIDIVGASMKNVFGTKPALRRTGSGDGMPPLDETTPFLSAATRPSNAEAGLAPNSMEMRSLDDSYSSSSSGSADSTSLHPIKPMTRVKAAKYVFLTLNKALVKSLSIIVAGSVGFYFIEDM